MANIWFCKYEQTYRTPWYTGKESKYEFIEADTEADVKAQLPAGSDFMRATEVIKSYKNYAYFSFTLTVGLTGITRLDIKIHSETRCPVCAVEDGRFAPPVRVVNYFVDQGVAKNYLKPVIPYTSEVLDSLPNEIRFSDTQLRVGVEIFGSGHLNVSNTRRGIALPEIRNFLVTEFQRQVRENKDQVEQMYDNVLACKPEDLA